jgi:hypothetical protein
MIAVLALTLTLQAQPPAQPLDPALIESTVRSLIEVFNREYFDAEAAARVEAELKKGLAEGRYAAATTPGDFGSLVTRDLFAVTKDKHVDLRPIVPRAPSAPAPRRDLPTTAGFRRTEILPGNVGLLDLAFFLRPVEHREAMAGAMATLQPAAALILDMRANGGGSPDTVALLMSYLFDRPGIELFAITARTGTRQVYSTTAEAIAYRDATRPVFVLTSGQSFSGGEGLAFLLQDVKRAVVIGEPTAGAANPGRQYPVNDRFEASISNAQLLSARSRTNWEGGGVTPDIRVAAADALRVGHMRAIEAILKTTPAGPKRDELTAILKSLEAGTK